MLDIDTIFTWKVEYTYFSFWSVLWLFLLLIPPGSTSILTAYRFNFFHGVISSVIAFLALDGFVPAEFASMATISYFVVDFANILLNDFVWKVPSYQNPQNRRVEYGHHCFCLFVGICCELFYRDVCTFQINPFLQLMYAEFSTPFLMVWRHYGYDSLAAVFVLAFFACRLVYHGLYFIPTCVRSCHPIVGYGFAIPYNILNLYFFYMIMKRMVKTFSKSKEKTKEKKIE